MAISIDENILMGAAAVIFVPLFVFFIKLIMQMATIQSQIQAMNASINEHKQAVTEFNRMLSDMRIIKLRLDNIEDQLNIRHKGSPDLR